MIPLLVSNGGAADARPAATATPQDANGGDAFAAIVAGDATAEQTGDVVVPVMVDAPDQEAVDAFLVAAEDGDTAMVLPDSLAIGEVPIAPLPADPRGQGLGRDAVDLPVTAQLARAQIADMPVPPTQTVLPQGGPPQTVQIPQAVQGPEAEPLVPDLAVPKRIPAEGDQPPKAAEIAVKVVAGPAQGTHPSGQMTAKAWGKPLDAAQNPAAERRSRDALPRETMRAVQTALPDAARPVPVVAAQAPAVMLQLAQAAKAEAYEKLARTADIDVGLTAGGSDRPFAAQGSVMPAAPLPGAEMARNAALQIAQAMPQGPGKTTEISLSPEELGRVRLSLTAGDGAITLVIAADRPETSDLLRRHIETLAQEFRDLGYDSLTFSFDGANEQAAGEQAADTDDEKTVFAAEQGMPQPSRTATDLTTGLDLRL